jgi:hypothetical protein
VQTAKKAAPKKRGRPAKKAAAVAVAVAVGGARQWAAAVGGS